MLETELQVIIDGFIGDLAQQREVRDTNLLLLGTFKGGLLDLRLARLSAIAHIGDSLVAPKAALLLATYGAS